MILTTILIACLVFGVSSFVPPEQHLVVLCHVLSDELKQRGCVVLQSQSNEFIKSLTGVEDGADRLSKEVLEYVEKSSMKLTHISFVGNSLGGLYTRCAMKSLSNLDSSGRVRIAGLEPYKFMTVATPHLGVRDYTFFDDCGVPVPSSLKTLVSKTLGKSGEDLFGSGPSSLLFKMATDDEFLRPLRSFQKRRLYANLNNDFVVPFGTSGIMPSSEILRLRKTHKRSYGIVEILPHNTAVDTTQSATDTNNRMICELNRCGWEKVVVNFKTNTPSCHNKICALQRRPRWLFGKVLGYDDGKWVMSHAAEWLLEHTAN